MIRYTYGMRYLLLALVLTGCEDRPVPPRYSGQDMAECRDFMYSPSVMDRNACPPDMQLEAPFGTGPRAWVICRCKK